MANEERLAALVKALKAAGGGPLMVKEIASKIQVSANTAGKYVDVAEAQGLVTTDRYSTARRVWLAKEGK